MGAVFDRCIFLAPCFLMILACRLHLQTCQVVRRRGPDRSFDNLTYGIGMAILSDLGAVSLKFLSLKEYPGVTARSLRHRAANPCPDGLQNRYPARALSILETASFKQE